MLRVASGSAEHKKVLIRRGAAALLAAILVLPASLVASAAQPGVASASTRCAPASSAKHISGLVYGQDGRDINAQISFDIENRQGQKIGMNGCRTNDYGATIWANMTIGGDGTANTGTSTEVPMGSSGAEFKLTGDSWQLPDLPSNAYDVWIEVWTRTAAGRKCPTCDGAEDVARYGFVNRRAIRLPASGVRLIAPLNCGIIGDNGAKGSSGAIQGALYNDRGQRVKFTSIYAWSDLTPDGSKPLQGWGVGHQATGSYKIANLASGQRYTVWATYAGRTVVKKVQVRACKATTLSIRSPA